jgi:acyl-CoA thioesterase FadM
MTSAVLQVRIPPRHCDSQGMMHAASPYEYFEDAFLAWLEEVEMTRDGQVLTRCSVTYVTVRDGRPSRLPGPLRQAIQASRQEM